MTRRCAFLLIPHSSSSSSPKSSSTSPSVHPRAAAYFWHEAVDRDQRGPPIDFPLRRPLADSAEAEQKQGKNPGAARRQRSTAPVSGIWAARRARAQRGPAQCSTWPSQVVSWAHRAHGSVAQRCPARTTMRRGPAGLPPGDQLLGCLGALAVRDV